jgi:putative ABC transport system substrate-binding protein
MKRRTMIPLLRKERWPGGPGWLGRSIVTTPPRQRGTPPGEGGEFDSRSSTRRKLFIAAAAWPALAWTGMALAQPKPKPVVIGWLHPGSRAAQRAHVPFKEQLAVLGWKEGTDYTLEERWAEAQVSRLPVLAEEIKAKKPSVIVAVLPQAVIAAAKAAPNVPVVQVQGTSPVDAGLAASLARPGGMVTGIVNLATDVSEKYLELLLVAVPQLKRIGFLIDSSGVGRAARMETGRRSAARYPVEARFAEAAIPEDLGPAVSHLAKEGVEGLVVLPSTWFPAERRRIMKLALEQRWPVVAGPSGFSDEGALLTYSADALANFRRAAEYVDRILKGAKPGDLPIEQPTKFDLVLNMKTAKALGITIPPSVLVRANRVIE